MLWIYREKKRINIVEHFKIRCCEKSKNLIKKSIPLVLLALIILNNIPNTKAAEMDIRETLLPGNYQYKEVTFTYKNTEKDTKEPINFNFKTNKSLGIFLVNRTHFGEFLQGNMKNTLYNISSTTHFEEEWSFLYLRNKYNLPFEIEDNGNYIMKFIILVYNNYTSDDISITLQLGYQSEAMIAFENTARIGLIVAIGLLTVFLAVRSFQYHKKDEIQKEMVLRRYSIAMFYAFLNYFLWEIDKWYKKDLNAEFFPRIEIGGELFLGFLLGEGYEVIQILFFTLIGIVIVFLDLVIEKQVKKKKSPKISLNLFFASLSLMLGWIVPIFDICFIWWVISLFIALMEFVGTYLKVIIQSSGYIRRKAIMLLIGMILSLFMGLIRGDIIENLYADTISIFGMFLVYYSLI
jgi:hypothetical protein